MAQVIIDEKGCRGCTLCVDVCPGLVFENDVGANVARVKRVQDCIGCKSCVYICPSACVSVTDCVEQRPFYRIEQNVAFVEHFIQAKVSTASITRSDWDEAYKDITATLLSLSHAIDDMIGRGAKAVGRQAGMVGASHLPELYEATDLNGLLSSLKERFKHAIDFDFSTDGLKVTLTLKQCRMYQILQGTNEEVGKASLCSLFHEYVAGLLRAYTGTNYAITMPQAGAACRLEYAPVER